MDAVEFIKQARRMGKAKGEVICFKLEETDTEIVERIEQWAKEHPVKTRQSELLKLFPETEMIDNYVCICPSRFVEGYREVGQNCNMNCEKCKRDFWLKEIE